MSQTNKLQPGQYYYRSKPNGRTPSGILCFRTPEGFSGLIELVVSRDVLAGLSTKIQEETSKQAKFSFTNQAGNILVIMGTVDGAPADEGTLLDAAKTIVARHDGQDREYHWTRVTAPAITNRRSETTHETSERIFRTHGQVLETAYLSAA